MKRYNVKATSLNKKLEYEAGLEANSPDEAREIFTTQVQNQVRHDYGTSRRGLSYLTDPCTLEIKEVPHQATTIDPEIFHNLRIASALALEINSGLKIGSGSVMKVARDKCGSLHSRKSVVLQDYVAWLAVWFQENHPDMPKYIPNERVQKAMKKVLR